MDGKNVEEEAENNNIVIAVLFVVYILDATTNE